MTVVRRATSGDERSWIAAVEALVSKEDRDGRIASAEEVASALANPQCFLLLAHDGDSPVGLLSAYAFPNVAAGGYLAYLYDIEVEAAYRRQGIGTTLVKALVELCKSEGVRLIWAGTTAANTPARRTFESTGGEVEGDSCIEYEWELD